MTTREEELADAGNEPVTTSVGDAVWISIKGPGVSEMLGILFMEYGVKIDKLEEVSPWHFRARVVEYDSGAIGLDKFSINDGTYVSEVEHGHVSPVGGTGGEEAEEGDTDEPSV